MSSCCTFGEASEFLSSTGNRDKVMALVQFAPMFLAMPAAGVTGSRALAESLLKLSALADGYRTVTRLSGLVDMLSESRIASLTGITNPLVRQITFAEAACSLAFFPAEHVALMNKFGVLPGGERITKHYSALAVFFWFWGLVLKVVRLSIQWSAKRAQINGDDATSKNAKRQLKTIQLQWVAAVSYLIFSMTCVGGKTRLFQCNGALASPVNAVFEALSPPSITLPIWVRGLLGLVAASTEFMH